MLCFIQVFFCSQSLFVFFSRFWPDSVLFWVVVATTSADSCGSLFFGFTKFSLAEASVAQPSWRLLLKAILTDFFSGNYLATCKAVFVCVCGGVANVLEAVVGVSCLVGGVGEAVPHSGRSVEQAQVLKDY